MGCTLIGDVPLRVIPVIDLKDGLVVHAVAGQRDRYRPVQTPLADSAEPLAVATGLSKLVGHRELYVADLDAISGGGLRWESYGELLEQGFRLWLDAGVADVERAVELSRFQAGGRVIRHVVVGSETLATVDELRAVLVHVGEDRLVFSLDLVGGEPRVAAEGWQTRPPMGIVEEVFEMGVKRLIVLDLRQVGRSAGIGCETLIGEIRKRWPQPMLVAGGGVRGREDLTTLAASGCHAALVASWLHQVGEAK